MKDIIKNIKQRVIKIYNYITHREIELTTYEVTWIKLFKYHYKDKYEYKGNWLETMKPLFTEIYGWNPDEDNNYKDYLSCMFNKLLDIHLKVHPNKGYNYKNLNSIFFDSFQPTYRYDGIELPIERAILSLIGEISCTRVILDNGKYRYRLDNDIFK